MREHFATDLALERTRLLYQGSQIPTLFMLLNGLACAWLLWNSANTWLLSGWLLWLVLLAVLRLVQVASFKDALPSQQAAPHWRRNFHLGAMVSGATWPSR